MPVLDEELSGLLILDHWGDFVTDQIRPVREVVCDTRWIVTFHWGPSSIPADRMPAGYGVRALRTFQCLPLQEALDSLVPVLGGKVVGDNVAGHRLTPLAWRQRAVQKF